MQASVDQVLRDAEFDGSPVPLDTPGLEGGAYLAALAHNGQRLTTRHILVMVRDDHVRVGFPYNAQAVVLVRSIPGARFLRDLTAWLVPLAKVRDLHAVIPQMEESLARASAGAAAPEQGADEGAIVAAAHERRAGRVLMLFALRPVARSVVRVAADARVIEGYGRTFLLDAKTASVSAPHLSREVGRPCCYAYIRAATPDETAVLEKYEAFIETERSRLRGLGRVR
ncbi:hypothetical protein VQ03_00320 [Methylobacterium tarhaniae]|uniref:Uncharacterized protein n=1 Tax=Methylobacterium tarhaniae TaxID=1187852 RepID=A0A0J6TGW6_9HYPH|nr:hypothetical protein [Methylobacterium tarhaniae]KMO44968.1 hypothetical protein VQ03_00320 [Methylobacterium tarhaniae]